MASVNQIIEQAEKLAAEATPGPWQADLDQCYSQVETADGKHQITMTDFETGVGCTEGDAAYIAHVNPANVLRLIDALKQMREVLRYLADREPGVYSPVTDLLIEDSAKLLAKLDAEE